MDVECSVSYLNRFVQEEIDAQYPFHRSLGGHQSRSGYFDKSEIWLLVGIEPNCLSHLVDSLVTIAISICRHLYIRQSTCKVHVLGANKFLYEGKYDIDAGKIVYRSSFHIGHILKFVILLEESTALTRAFSFIIFPCVMQKPRLLHFMAICPEILNFKFNTLYVGFAIKSMEYSKRQFR